MNALTRIAPTPSGYLHQGNWYSFVVTALMAWEVKADILLRIDDMDRARYRKAYVDDIFLSLDHLGISWQAGPNSPADLEREWSQRHRMTLYRAWRQKLQDAGGLFPCTCSRKELREADAVGYPGRCYDQKAEGLTEAFSWRLRTNQETISLKTWPKGEVEATLPTTQRDFVVWRKDDWPAYHLCSVADDFHFGVSHIVRGADLQSSTLAQAVLAQRARHDFEKFQFLHHDLISGPGGAKLSKSAGARAVSLRDDLSGRQFYRQLAISWNLPGSIGGLAELSRAVEEAGGLARVLSPPVSGTPENR